MVTRLDKDNGAGGEKDKGSYVQQARNELNRLVCTGLVYSTLDSKKDEEKEEGMEVYEKVGDEDGGVEDEDDCRRDGGGGGR